MSTHGLETITHIRMQNLVLFLSNALSRLLWIITIMLDYHVARFAFV